MTDTKALTITRHLAVPLTTSEKNEKNDQLVRTLNDLERLEENFASLREQHKSNVKHRSVTIRELSHDLGTGYLMRPVSCEQRVDLEKNRMITTRLDTGVVIDERALTVEEAKEFAKRQP